MGDGTSETPDGAADVDVGTIRRIAGHLVLMVALLAGCSGPSTLTRSPRWDRLYPGFFVVRGVSLAGAPVPLLEQIAGDSEKGSWFALLNANVPARAAYGRYSAEFRRRGFAIRAVTAACTPLPSPKPRGCAGTATRLGQSVEVRFFDCRRCADASTGQLLFKNSRPNLIRSPDTPTRQRPGGLLFRFNRDGTDIRVRSVPGAKLLAEIPGFCLVSTIGIFEVRGREDRVWRSFLRRAAGPGLNLLAHASGNGVAIQQLAGSAGIELRSTVTLISGTKADPAFIAVDGCVTN